jgi:hypothetical protein
VVRRPDTGREQLLLPSSHPLPIYRRPRILDSTRSRPHRPPFISTSTRLSLLLSGGSRRDGKVRCTGTPGLAHTTARDRHQLSKTWTSRTDAPRSGRCLVGLSPALDSAFLFFPALVAWVVVPSLDFRRLNFVSSSPAFSLFLISYYLWLGLLAYTLCIISFFLIYNCLYSFRLNGSSVILLEFARF